MSDENASTAIKDALTRSMLASARHRAATARLLGLSESDLLAVLYLHRAGELTPTSLGRLLSLTSGGTTALVQRLERAGLVIRERHPADGRSRLLRLSRDGRRSADRALSSLERALDVAIERLPSGSRTSVALFLNDAAGLAEQHADGAVADVVGFGDIEVDASVPTVAL